MPETPTTNIKRRRLIKTGLAASLVAPAAVDASPLALHRAFLDWYAANQHRFRIPLTFTSARQGVRVEGLSFGFQDRTPLLRGWIGKPTGYQTSELLIDAEYDENWDALAWPDLVAPVPRDGGWVCATCEHDNGTATLFPSPAAIWEDHLFNPLLAFVNEKIASSEYIVFYEGWVELRKEAVRDSNHDARFPALHVFPLQSAPYVGRAPSS